MDKNVENVYLKKISANKYELITKNFELTPKVYKMYVIDDVIVLRQTYYKKDYNNFEAKANSSNTAHNTENISNTTEYKSNYIQNQHNTQNTNNQTSKPSTLSSDFVICEDQNDARELSRMLTDDIKEGKILGIKGFDKKYYIFKTEYYNKLKALIIESARNSNKETTLEKLITETKEPEDALRGTIEILKEEGNLFERNKVYKLIE